MAEYIEREVALKIINNYAKATDENGQVVADAIRDIIAVICPTADVVEVVRCKECEYYNEDCMSPHSGWCECLERAEYNEHFCCYGVRKGEGE